MRRIVELMKMPEWWFSAVFIAIIAGIIAAFAKDWISRALSSFSQAYKTRRSSQEAKLEEKAATLAAHPELLIIEFIRTVGQEIAIIALTALLLSAPFLINASGLGKTTDLFGTAALALIVIAAILLVIVLFYGMYINTRKIELCLRARKKLREKLAKHRE
jgi:hypothetical protein